MSIVCPRYRIIGLLFSCGFSWLTTIRATEEPAVVAVTSRISDDYVRPRLPDGAFEPENYAFGEGGLWRGSMGDLSIEKLHFMDVARTIAPSLRAQNYLPATDPAKTKLLIMLYWGTTSGSGEAAGSGAFETMQMAKGSQDLDLALVANSARTQEDSKNAAMLGYSDALSDSQGPAISALRWRHQDLLDEVGDNRYFVVLMAYDFQILTKNKKHKLLWETRFSIRQHGSNFDQQLAAMAKYASRYFGQDSHGLLRKTMPIVHVKLDELRIIGVEPDSK